MALMTLNKWDKYKVARKVLGWFGTVLVVLKNVLSPGCLEWSERL